MTLPVIRRNISPIPTGRRLGFLSKGIKRHAKNDSNDGERLSAVHSFLMISGMALPKSVELVPSCFVIRILLHISASSPDGPAPSLVLTAVLFTKSASIASNFIGSTCSGVSVSKTFNSAFFYPVDVFTLTDSRFFDLMEGSCSACYKSIVSLHCTT